MEVKLREGKERKYASCSYFYALIEKQMQWRQLGDLCRVEQNYIGGSTRRKWLSRFKEGHFGASDSPNSRKSLDFDEDFLNSLSTSSTRELAE